MQFNSQFPTGCLLSSRQVGKVTMVRLIRLRGKGHAIEKKTLWKFLPHMILDASLMRETKIGALKDVGFNHASEGRVSHGLTAGREPTSFHAHTCIPDWRDKAVFWQRCSPFSVRFWETMVPQYVLKRAILPCLVKSLSSRTEQEMELQFLWIKRVW